MKFALAALLWTCVFGACLAGEQRGAYLGELNWPQAEQELTRMPVVVLPFAAGAKEHGPHLPMNADQAVMQHLLDAAVQHQAVVVAPPILHGWFPAFREFPGTEVSDPGVFQDYVFAVAESLVRSGARRLIILNTGVSRATGLPLSIVAREIQAQHGVPTLVVSWDDLETEEVEALQRQAVGGHADEVETAINLHLQPDLVDMAAATKDDGPFGVKDYPGYRPGLFSRDVAAPSYSRTGLRGDPTRADAETGRKMLAIMTANWLRAIEGFSEEPLAAN
jgi:creatinine amidohydrolase